MPIQEIFPIVILLVCALLQSVMGVGLIMLGLPTLIILGYSFPLALSWCLPGSLMINLNQIFQNRSLYKKEDAYSFTVMILLYVVTLFFIKTVLGIEFSKYAAGMVLVMAGVMGLNHVFREMIIITMGRHGRVIDGITGVVHAVSGLGGSVLALSGLAKGRHTVIGAQKFVAGGYFALGCAQLFWFNASFKIYPIVCSLMISVPSYYLSSRYITPKIDSGKFRKIVFNVILIYGLLLLVQESSISMGMNLDITRINHQPLIVRLCNQNLQESTPNPTITPIRETIPDQTYYDMTTVS